MRVLVHAVFDSLANQPCQFLAHHKIRKTLAEIYRIILYRQLIHYSENSGANRGKLAFNIHVLFLGKSKGYSLLKGS